jgi:hypothetical protein
LRIIPLVFGIFLVLAGLDLAFNSQSLRARLALRADAYCVSCHAMRLFKSEKEDPACQSLAMIHCRGRDLAPSGCASCHTGPGAAGWLRAQALGVRHALANARGVSRTAGPRDPWPNANCLQCHDNENRFIRKQAHMDEWKGIRKGRVSCVDCHSPAHARN